MSDAKRRLKRLEAKLGKLPVSENERRAAEERLRCRYTLILEMEGRVLHEVSMAHGIEVPPYEPVHPKGEILESIRAHHEVWNLPVVSEKSVEEARAYLGPDNPERALEDAKIIGYGPWRIWLKETYIPALELMAKTTESGGPEQLIEWVMRKVEAEAKQEEARPRPSHYDRVMQRHFANKKRAAERRARGEGGQGLAG